MSETAAPPTAFPAQQTGMARPDGGSRLRIVHTTRITYASPVRTSFNEVRMTPLTLPGQTALEARVEVTPRVAAYRYWDYWGSHVVAFDTSSPHDSLEVVASSLVEVEPAEAEDVAAGWDDLALAAVRDEHVEWLSPRPATRLGDELRAELAEATAGLRPHDAALAVCSWVGERLQYVPGATGVHTSAEEAYTESKGVCQDFAHIAVGALRAMGIPARYVSGYLHPVSDSAVGETVEGQSHAWVQWWVGSWFAFDPTNGRPAGTDHVLVGRGRDYFDVTPFSGVYSGGGASSMSVAVQVTRMR